MLAAVIDGLPYEAALPLATALVQHTAESIGAHVLFFKGIAATAQGLRSQRSSVDVDVFVHPAHHSALVTALIRRGWRTRALAPTDTQLIPSHAVTMVHAHWPCDLDLHYYFVGTFAEPTRTFETLWNERVDETIGGVPVAVPSPDGHRLLLAINTVRDTGLRRAADDSNSLAAYFSSHPERWAEVLRIGERTRSLSVLREFAMGHQLTAPAHDLSAAELEQLYLVIKYRASGVGNLKHLLSDSSLGLRERLSLIRRILWRTPSEIAEMKPEFDGGAWAAVLENVRRAGRGVAQWRDSTRRTVHTAHDHSGALPAGGEFQPRRPDGELAPARLRQTGSGTVLANAPAEPQPTIRGGVADAGVVTVAQCARAGVAGDQYLMTLDPWYLEHNPHITPPVVRVDASGQELLALCEERPRSAVELSEMIASRHAVERADVEPGISGFLAHLQQAGILVPE